MSRKSNEVGLCRYCVIAGAALAIFTLAMPARAGTVLFDSLVGASNINTAVSATNWEAVSFQTDSNNYQLTNVTVSLEQSTATSGKITALLLSSLPSVSPGMTLLTLGTVNDSSLSAGSFTLFSFAGNNFGLAPNTVYWIALEGTSTTATDGGWQFNTTETGIHASSQSEAFAVPPPNWTAVPITMAFNGFVPAMEVDANSVSGPAPTPEPATLWLAGAFLAIVVLLYSSRRCRAMAAIPALLMVLTAMPARAGTVLYSSLAGANGNDASGVSGDTWLAESFQTDNHSYQLTNVTINLAQSTATSGMVSVFLFSYAISNVPGSQLASLGSVSDSSLPDPSSAGFLPFSFGGNNFALAPNTSYYVVVEGTSLKGLVDGLWEEGFGESGINATGQYAAITTPPPNNWTSAPLNNPAGINFAMEVDAQMVSGGTAAPEPSTLWLAAALLLAIFSRRALRAAAAAVFAILAIAVPAHADTVLFSSLAGANIADSTTSVFGNFATGVSFQTDNHKYLLTDVAVNLGQGTTTTGTVTVLLFSDSATVPDSPLATLGTVDDSLLPDPSTDGFGEFGFVGNDYELDPNTRYWIVLEGSSTVGGMIDAVWEGALGQSGIQADAQYEASAEPPPDWSSVAISNAPNNIVDALEVDAQVFVPEPATFWLAGGVGLAFAAGWSMNQSLDTES